jgi:hypothetical protein
MHTCANRSGGPNTNKFVLAHCAWSPLPIGGGGHHCANILAHRSTLQAHTTSVRKGYIYLQIFQYHVQFYIAYWQTEQFGAPCLPIFIPIAELYKQEMEIRCKKDDGPIKK